MENWYKAIDLRYSVRNYKSGISASEMASLQSFANSISSHGIRLAVTRNARIFGSKLFAKRITGTDCFCAVISKNGKDIYSGYLGEIFVLECVSRGFGTCWLGASYKQAVAEEAVELDRGEAIVCVISIGIPHEDEEKPLRKRLSIYELTDKKKEEFEQLPLWQQYAVRAARIAPSAMNHQPWQFYIYEDSIGIVNVSRNLGYGMIDCGIAMIHAEIGASHSGESFDWDLTSKDDEVILYPIKNKEKTQEDEYMEEPSLDYDTEDSFDGEDEPAADEKEDFDLSDEEEDEATDDGLFSNPDDDGTFN